MTHLFKVHDPENFSLFRLVLLSLKMAFEHHLPPPPYRSLPRQSRIYLTLSLDSPVLESSRKWNHIIHSLWDWLLYIAYYRKGSSMFQPASFIHSFIHFGGKLIVLWIFHISSLRLSFDGHLGGFYPLAVVNICVQVLCGRLFAFLLGVYRECNCQDYHSPVANSLRKGQMFSKAATPLSIPARSVRGSQFLPSLPTLVIFGFDYRHLPGCGMVTHCRFVKKIFYLFISSLYSQLGA